MRKWLITLILGLFVLSYSVAAFAGAEGGDIAVGGGSGTGQTGGDAHGGSHSGHR